MEVEQPLILDWIKDKYAFIQINCLSYRCVIREDWLDNIDVWIHEFIEHYLLNSFYVGDSYIIAEDGDPLTIAHLVTSLCVTSAWNDVLINPDQFWEQLMLG